MNQTRHNRIIVKAILMFCLASMAFGCTKYKLKIQSQANEIEDLKEDKQKLEAEKAELEAMNAELTSAKDSLTTAKTDLEATLSELSEKIKELEAELADMNAGKEALSKDLKEKDALLKELRKKEAQAKQRLDTLKKMLEQFKSLIKAGKLNVKIRRGKMVLELPSAILFESGKADLSDEGQKTLAEVAKVLVKIKKREFQVAGHTDNVPIKSSNFESNWELSTARSVTVVKFLQKNNLNPQFLSAAGYSEYQPESSNAKEDGKAMNRRIEIVLMPNLDELPDLSDLEKELKK